jgi:hypothetical protein
MPDNPRETKQPEEQDHRHDTGWLSRLDNLQKLLAAIAAVVVALGGLGTAAYIARDSWQKALGITGSGPSASAPGTGPDRPSPTGATVSPSITTSGSPTSSPRQSDITGYGHISSASSSGSSCSDPVTVTIVISNPASAGRELWLMAVVMTGAPTHPVYYAKKELHNAAGQQTVPIQFYGATNGSFRNLVIVSSAPASFAWLNQNLANDGNAAWDLNRTTKPSGVTVISPSYGVTTRC